MKLKMVLLITLSLLTLGFGLASNGLQTATGAEYDTGGTATVTPTLIPTLPTPKLAQKGTEGVDQTDGESITEWGPCMTAGFTSM